MWKRDEPVRPGAGRPAEPAASTPLDPPGRFDRDLAKIGKSVVIKGEVSGSEDLTIEGKVEGKIELRNNVLTIGPNGRVQAQVLGKVVVVHGHVIGNITASEKIDIRDNGSVEGDLSAPRVAIAEGALFRGSVDMQRASKAAPRTAQGTAGPADDRGDAKGATNPATSGRPAQVGHGARVGA